MAGTTKLELAISAVTAVPESGAHIADNRRIRSWPTTLSARRTQPSFDKVALSLLLDCRMVRGIR
jgi:hypothetical protein